MTLGELIDILAAMPPGAMVALGKPNSYRGDYAELAFAPGEPRPASEVLADARACVGATFEGYKGGIYRMDLGTVVHRARWGEYGGDDDALKPAFFGIKAAAELQAELERCSAEVLALTKERDAALKRCVALEAEVATLCDPLLKEVSIKPGAMEMTMEGATAIVKRLAIAMITFLEGVGAKNYAEQEISLGTNDFVMLVQRRSGRTPHQLRVDAEAERDAARNALSAAVDRLAEVSNYIGPFGTHQQMFNLLTETINQARAVLASRGGA